MPNGVPQDKMLAQIAFKYGLNYEFVKANDGGNQIFAYLPVAISDALGIPKSDIVNYGLEAKDTTSSKKWITTVAVFMMPKLLNDTLAANLTTPASIFYHNKDDTVRALTDLIDPSWPLEHGKQPYVDGPNKVPDSDASPSDKPESQGGPMGSGMGASHKVNPTSAGIATGAVLGACAYGAAMFFVARRYRNKKMSHKRSSSVPSTNRYTGSSLGGAWMSGARNGRLSPGQDSRGSRGSSTSNGRSVRTQMISAPVLDGNTLGWN